MDCSPAAEKKSAKMLTLVCVLLLVCGSNYALLKVGLCGSNYASLKVVWPTYLGGSNYVSLKVEVPVNVKWSGEEILVFFHGRQNHNP